MEFNFDQGSSGSNGVSEGTSDFFNTQFKREAKPSSAKPKVASPKSPAKGKQQGRHAKAAPKAKPVESMVVEDASPVRAQTSKTGTEPADDKKRKADHPSRTVKGEHIFQKRFDDDDALPNKTKRNNSISETEEGTGEPSKVKRTKREADIHATIFSSSSFENFDLDPRLLKALTDSGFHTPTMVQNSAIPFLLQGKDVLIKAHTGSGKTLSYLIPLINRLLLHSKNSLIKREQGTYGLIISPTRELCIQIYDVLHKLSHKFPWMVPGQITGGEQREREKARLRKGITVLVATPGRLLDHLQNTNCFKVDKLSYLVLDEADRLLDMGFEKCIRSILERIVEKQEGLEKFMLNNEQRQNVLASATLNRDVDRLALLSLREPAHVGDQEDEDEDEMMGTHSLPAGLIQYFVTVSPRLKLIQLGGFVHTKTTVPSNYDKNLEQTRLESNPLLYDSSAKIIVFASNCDTVDFIFSLFSNVQFPTDSKKTRTTGLFPLISVPFFKLHGHLSQEVRKQTWVAFKAAKSAVMVCTDVAARGLDLPSVNWIVQYDAPSDPKAYIHRIGRTARIGQDGRALLFVFPSEKEYVDVLKTKNMTFTEIPQDSLTKKLVTNIEPNPRNDNKVEEILFQKKLMDIIEDEKNKELELKELGIKGYQSFIRSYQTHVKSTRHIFNLKNLHIGHVAKSYCLTEVPSNLSSIIDQSQKKKAREKEREEKYLHDGRDPTLHAQPKYMKAKNIPSFEFGA